MLSILSVLFTILEAWRVKLLALGESSAWSVLFHRSGALRGCPPGERAQVIVWPPLAGGDQAGNQGTALLPSLHYCLQPPTGGLPL